MKMDKAPATFDWIAWHATIPGIPADWGKAPIEKSAKFARPTAELDEPVRLAA